MRNRVRKTTKRALGFTLALGAGLVGAIVLAAPASAHSTMLNAPKVSCDASTGTYSITYSGQGDYDLSSTVVLTSKTPAESTVSPQSQSVTPVQSDGGWIDPFTLVQTGIPGSATSASISIEETWSDNVKKDATAPTVALDGACGQSSTSVIPAAPSFTDANCADGEPSYTIPTTAGVTYLVDGTPTAAGTYPATNDTTVTITTVAQPGYTLAGTTTFTHKFCPPTCDKPVTPVPPSFTDATCVNGRASYTVPTSAGVAYLVNGTPTAAGTYSGEVGSTVTITAVAQPGYTLSGTTTFTHKFCPPTCMTPVSPTPPAFADDTCVDFTPSGAMYTIPATTGVSYQVNGTTTPAGTYPAASGSTVTVVAIAKPGYTLSGVTAFSHTYPVAPTCTTATSPQSPTYAEDSCVGSSPSGATYTIPTTAGVSYEVEGVSKSAGSYPATAGSTVTITAVAQPGYTLTGTTSFSHTFTAAPTCAAPPPPRNDTPGLVFTETPGLAFTGTAMPVAATLGIGVLILALGVAALVLTARRT